MYSGIIQVRVRVCVFRHARSQDASKAINEHGLD
jgi:hypothetical protein